MYRFLPLLIQSARLSVDINVRVRTNSSFSLEASDISSSLRDEDDSKERRRKGKRDSFEANGFLLLNPFWSSVALGLPLAAQAAFEWDKDRAKLRLLAPPLPVPAVPVCEKTIRGKV